MPPMRSVSEVLAPAPDQFTDATPSRTGTAGSAAHAAQQHVSARYRVPPLDGILQSEPSADSAAAAAAAAAQMGQQQQQQHSGGWEGAALDDLQSLPILSPHGETAMLVPEVEHAWYAALSATSAALLHTSIAGDVARLVAVEPSRIAIISARPDPHGTLLGLRFLRATVGSADFTPATLVSRFDTMVAKGMVSLPRATATLRELGWLSAHPVPSDDLRTLRLEKLRLDFTSGLEGQDAARCREAAKALHGDYPYEGHRVICDAIKGVLPHLTVQDISVRWGDLLAEHCGEAVAGGGALKAVRPLHHAVLSDLGGALMVSKAATRAFQRHVEDRRAKLRALQEGGEGSGAVVGCAEVTLLEGACGRVVAQVPAGSLASHSVGYSSLPPHCSFQYSCSLNNDMPSVPFIDYASL